jgi:hypothetical protein
MMLWGIGGIFGYASVGFIADTIGRRRGWPGDDVDGRDKPGQARTSPAMTMR